MKSDPARARVTDPDTPALDEVPRAAISLVIFVHLFLVALCLFGNVAALRSQLQSRLLGSSLIQAYVQPLNLNPDDTPYHLTHGDLEDVDHHIQILPEGADPSDSSSWVTLPDVGWGGSDRYKRYQRLAKTLVNRADFEEQSGAIARGVAEHFVHRGELTPAELRARRHLLQHWTVFTEDRPEARDPNAAGYLQTPYAADLVITDDGTVFPNKKSEAGETAQVGESGSSQP